MRRSELLLGASAVLTACGVGQSIEDLIQKPHPIEIPSPTLTSPLVSRRETPPLTPRIPTPNSALIATREHLYATGRPTSFEPKGPFGWYEYSKIVSSMAFCRLDVGSGDVLFGTCVFLRSPKPDRYLLAISDHGFLQHLSDKIFLYQPELRRRPLELQPDYYRRSDSSDGVVLTGPADQLADLMKHGPIGLEWEDKANQVADRYLLIGGYPFDFFQKYLMSGDPTDILSLATVVDVTPCSFVSDKTQFRVESDYNIGISGGVVSAIRRGRPVIVGVITHESKGSLGPGCPQISYLLVQTPDFNNTVHDLSARPLPKRR